MCEFVYVFVCGAGSSVCEFVDFGDFRNPPSSSSYSLSSSGGITLENPLPPHSSVPPPP